MRTALCLIAALTLGGCASVGKTKAPVCDGKHRRPANLYGSVLDPTAPPGTTPPPGTAQPEKVSALPSDGSCRG